MARARLYLTEEEKQWLLNLEAQNIPRHTMAAITKVNINRIREFLGRRALPCSREGGYHKITPLEKERLLINKNLEAQQIYDQIKLNDILKITITTRKVTRNYKCQVIGIYEHYKLLQNLKRAMHKICLKVGDLVLGSTEATIIKKA